MGKYVPTVMVSCMLHDSNLVNVMLSKMLRELDTTKPDPFQPHVNPAVRGIKGNKATESFSFNAVRFIAGCFKKSKDWRAFMRSTHGDGGGIAPIKSSRFWAALIIGGDYLFPRFDQIWEFYDTIKRSQRDKQIHIKHVIKQNRKKIIIHRNVALGQFWWRAEPLRAD